MHGRQLLCCTIIFATVLEFGFARWVYVRKCGGCRYYFQDEVGITLFRNTLASTTSIPNSSFYHRLQIQFDHLSRNFVLFCDATIYYSNKRTALLRIRKLPKMADLSEESPSRVALLSYNASHLAVSRLQCFNWHSSLSAGLEELI